MVTVADHLVQALEVLSAAAADPPELASLNPNSFAAKRVLLTNVADHPGVAEFGQMVAAALGWDPSEMISISDSPSSGSGLRAEHLGRMLVARARHQEAAEVLHSFFALVESNVVELSEVHVLWGLRPATPVSLPGGLQLVALEDAPPSLLRDRYLGVPERLNAPPAGHPAVVPRPGAALVRRLEHGPVFLSAPEFGAHPVSQAATEEVLDVVRILTALLRRPVFPLAQGYVLDEATPLWLGGGWGGQSIYWSFQAAHEPEDLDAERLASGVAAYLGSNEALRNGLRTALERLRAAYIHPWFHERAMDLGIALEATLFAGDRSSYTGELAYRFKIRGTLLLGGDPSERRRTAELLSQVYKLRSRVAHGGRSPHGNEAEEAVISESLELCCRLVEALVMRGSVPDWDGIAMGWEVAG
ncbi:MAG: hypothetical protein QOI20_3407 [Acidimicrobiaceae bacterium]|jgi:hypothetical protein|nr:hypothetical protein [Acidimicrobiaceae bacterium]